jgi:carbon starvation protein
LIAACTLEPGVYLSMNMKGEPAAVVAQVNAFNFPVTTEQMDGLAKDLGEKSLFGRAGGAATLAVGMAHIFSQAVSGRWLDLWYHFAIMFEALFILTTLDAGTRVGRYILQDFLGGIWKPLGDTKHFGGNLLASGLMVCGWGYFLIQGVRDPLGGINSLWPLFGIANQMLAAVALCLATTILLKMQLTTGESKIQSRKPKGGRPALAFIALIPLIWLLAVTTTAGVQKIGHSDPRIGFLAQAAQLRARAPELEVKLAFAKATGDAQAAATAGKALQANRTFRFNQRLDAVVAGFFLTMVWLIVLFSIREWILLLARWKVADLRETPPVWLPDYAIAESKPTNIVSLIALGLGLAKELSGEAHLERAQQAQLYVCDQPVPGDRLQVPGPKTEQQIYLESTEQRFDGIRRCC